MPRSPSAPSLLLSRSCREDGAQQLQRPLSSGSALPPLRLAVVGHVEWVEFLAVDQLPCPGAIGHALQILQEPAGGGAVVAVQMARLQQQPVQFFTALGRDSVGEACFCLLYTSPSPRDLSTSRMPSSA